MQNSHMHCLMLPIRSPHAPCHAGSRPAALQLRSVSSATHQQSQRPHTAGHKDGNACACGQQHGGRHRGCPCQPAGHHMRQVPARRLLDLPGPACQTRLHPWRWCSCADSMQPTCKGVAAESGLHLVPASMMGGSHCPAHCQSPKCIQ